LTSQIIARAGLTKTNKKIQKPTVSAMVVGKDILELVSGGMYIDPMSMIREYIQNAVDSIDEADSEKLYEDKPAKISLTLNQ